jgi:predicted PurR-regulated permease PerM
LKPNNLRFFFVLNKKNKQTFIWHLVCFGFWLFGVAFVLVLGLFWGVLWFVRVVGFWFGAVLGVF